MLTNDCLTVGGELEQAAAGTAQAAVRPQPHGERTAASTARSPLPISSESIICVDQNAPRTAMVRRRTQDREMLLHTRAQVGLRAPVHDEQPDNESTRIFALNERRIDFERQNGWEVRPLDATAAPEQHCGALASRIMQYHDQYFLDSRLDLPCQRDALWRLCTVYMSNADCSQCAVLSTLTPTP